MRQSCCPLFQEVSSSVWLATAVKKLPAAVDGPQSAPVHLPVFPLPFLVDPLRVTCFATIHLTARFLEYLAWDAGQADTPTHARRVVDAFVYAVHGPRRPGDQRWLVSEADGRCHWESVLAYFPPALRALVHCATKQCKGDADLTWPHYVLAQVGREDLGGTYYLLSCFWEQSDDLFLLHLNNAVFQVRR